MNNITMPDVGGIVPFDGNDKVSEFKGYKPYEELTAKRMDFVVNYMSSKDNNVRYNATQSYLEAYGCEYVTANTEGGKLLSDPRIKKYQRYLLRNTGFNDEAVDNKLKSNIFDSSGRDSTVAIREYNKVKGRSVNKNVNITLDANKLLEQMGSSDDDDGY